MRRFFLTVPALAALWAAGCQLPMYQSVGWHLDVGTPAVVHTPVAVQQTSGSLAVGGLGAGPMAPMMGGGAPRAMIFAAQPGVDACQNCGAVMSRPTTAALAQASPCDVDELCRRIERLERQRPPTAEAMPMPKGPQ